MSTVPAFHFQIVYALCIFVWLNIIHLWQGRMCEPKTLYRDIVEFEIQFKIYCWNRQGPVDGTRPTVQHETRVGLAALICWTKEAIE